MTNVVNHAQLPLQPPPLPPILGFFLNGSHSSIELHPVARPSCAINISYCMA